MSNQSLPTLPINLSLPSKPITTTTSTSTSTSATAGSSKWTSSIATPLIPGKPTFALPQKPATSTVIALSSRRRSPSPDSYRGRSPRRGTVDTYRPISLSPPPRPRRRSRSISRDRAGRYRSPSPSLRGPDSYIPPRSPPPSPSPPPQRYNRHRSPVRHRYSPSPSPSPSPPPRSYKKRQERSYSYSRSPSPRRRPRTPSLDRQSRSKRTSKDTENKSHIVEKERNSGNPIDDQKKLSLKDRIGGFRVGEIHSPRTATVPAKRSPSPLLISAQPIPKLTKAVPTGPKGSRTLSTTATLPTGPKADRAPPTGPRNRAAPPIASPSSALQQAKSRTSDKARSSTPESASDEDMPGPSRYRGNSSRRGGTPNKATPSAPTISRQLSPPLHDHAQITSQHGNNVQLKAQWLDNPKAPLANFLGNGTGGADLGSEYRAEEGMIGSKKMFRVTVTGDKRAGIIGVGDHTNRKEAEKLAALSAVLQLTAAGILDQGKTGGKSPAATNGSSSTATNHVSGGSNETANLSDGTQISYERARQFMEYYCQRYKFGKPDIGFSQTSQTSHSKSRRGKPSATMTWDAVITVGNRKIGMGQSANKKGAQVKAYLDVTQYLESCDPGLWRDFLEFSKKDKSASLGMAPHLVFQMSDRLNEDIQGLCGDIRNSRLWEHAPPTSSAANEHHPLPQWAARSSRPLNAKEMQNKSLELQDRLAKYQSDPKLDAMRNQRHALPVTSRATEILTKIEVNDVTIVMAATGSGKTTQVPQLLFDDYINRGQGAKCNIVCTQPRRLAAMSVAERIADERGQPLGKEVGYQVRFDVKLPQPNGSITFCTTGIFLKRMQSSLGPTADASAVARMDEVTHIVVDEVHERDIDTDLLLVVLKRLLADRKARNKPIKIILMSATIDPTLFKSYFADSRGRAAPVAEIPGRTFPVERTYLDDIVPQLQGLPMNKGGWVFNEKNVSEYLNAELNRDPANFAPGSGMALEIPYPLVALTIADVMKRSDDGHVLVFLPGWDEIKKVADILMDTRAKPLMGTNFNDTSKFSIHYLHSTIPAAEQKEVFRPPPKGVRRIILATNIAETSITIPDVVYVVDTARVKEKRYDPERHMSSLVSAWVGSSNLNQRAGRAGRHREGEYYGLLSKKRLESLDPHQLVEMKRSDLSNVVMHVKALNLGEVEEVLAATIEPPEPSRIVAAMEVLRMLGAMDVNQNLTALGRVLLQLPVEAAIGKLCLYGSFFRCLDSALTLAAVLTNRDPFLAPIALKAEADRIKDSWCPPAFRSDPLAIVAAYNQWSSMDDRGDYRSANQFCSDNFLSKPTLLQIKQVKGSLLQSLDQVGVIAVSAGGAVSRIGRRLTVPKELDEHGNSLPLLAALIAMANAPNFALRTSEKTCRTSQDKTVFIHASSVNSRKRETGGPEQASESFNPAEKRLYSFGEKSRNVPLGGKETGGITQLRSVTRLDPMTYMLFGAYELVVTQRGLECDRWLPVVGNLHALDDVQRLKVLLDGCMLRVFEGVGKSLTVGRDERWKQSRNNVQVKQGSSRITNTQEEEEIFENESDDDDDEAELAEAKKEQTRIVKPLSGDEIKELELLTTDVVRVLDAYSAEREGGSTAPTRPVTPAMPSHAPGYARRGNGRSTQSERW
ncbi:uncharacterized protein I303_101321 [Kwoniella dejecticola CBS 10117]|uniref:Nuclear DNA helicase II n=1 Tax=Kwoniella dejecticola CBS 10117 TaxID=1296121 RepID=A0A1A6AHF7_9TREE|nr:nuclear DNA helicase II [Kwoniella dejecticola CBS 10117]OBR89502.1 nuclear DNA helicase II [Kwoniella dejecticola CBS 10117]